MLAMPESPIVTQLWSDSSFRDLSEDEMEARPRSNNGVLLQPSRTRSLRFLRRFSDSNDVPTRCRQPWRRSSSRLLMGPIDRRAESIQTTDNAKP